jgi:hypothetical protein
MTKTNKYKLGLDLHGVSDKVPEFFALVSKLMVDAGHEVIIITGKMKSHGAEEEAKSLGLHYTKIYSIVDYNIEKGVELKIDEKGYPWIDEEIWNKTKAEICKKEKIDLHIDDSKDYGKYFESPYALVSISLNKPT